MNIAGTEVNLRHRAFEIYISGCRGPHCPGCHNEELWDFKVGEPYERRLSDLVEKIRCAPFVDYVWLLGGEPLDQPTEGLLLLIQRMPKPVMLWTHYNEVPDMFYPFLAYAKIGPYIENGQLYTEPVFGIRLANREQKIIRLGG